MSVTRYWVDRQLAYLDPAMRGIVSGDAQQMVLASDYDALRQAAQEAARVLDEMVKGWSTDWDCSRAPGHPRVGITMVEVAAVLRKLKALGVEP